MTVKQKIKAKADKSFVDNWREAWKWLSVQMALVVGIITTYATTYPEDFAAFVDMLPEWARPLVGLFIAVAAIYLRLKKQGEGNHDG